jgi:hypothetical protein
MAILVPGGVLACLGLTLSLALQVAHQADTINKLHPPYGTPEAIRLWLLPPRCHHPPEGRWVQAYRWADRTALRGIQGPPIVWGATTFRSASGC